MAPVVRISDRKKKKKKRDTIRGGKKNRLKLQEQ